MKMNDVRHFLLILLLLSALFSCGKYTNNLGYLLYDLKCVPQSFGDNGLIEATVRDFSKIAPDAHPDYNCKGYFPTESTRLVKDTLDLIERKPIFNQTHGDNNGITMLTSKADFDQWYRDVPGTNFTFTKYLNFEDSDGMFEYINSSFFPLSETEGFGKESNNKNFAFSTEIHIDFTYLGGEEFTFTGDDDLW